MIITKQFFPVDVDDTLVCWDRSRFSPEKRTEMRHAGYTTDLVPHQPNINTLIKFAKLGYHVHVWSATGYEWAAAVVKHLGIQEYVHSYSDKPKFYMDDKDCEEWMGERVYRDPS